MKQKILVIKHGALGDFFIALGAFKAIRDFHKGDHLVILTTPAYVQLAKDCGYFDEIIVDSRPKFYNFFKLTRLRAKLLSYSFHRVYDLQNSSRTSWYYKMLGPSKRPEWNGIAPGCSHPQTLPNRRKTHAYPRFKDQLKSAGIEDVMQPDLSWVKADISKFNVKVPYALLAPGSSSTRMIKRWPAENYGELAKILLKGGIMPVILGGRDEKEAVEIILKICPEATNLAEKTSLYEIIELAKQAEGVVGNDTGPLHMASIANCVTIVLWSNASDPAVFAPQGEHVTVIYEERLKNLSVNRVESALKDRVIKS